ncbi:MAG: NAD(P)/FAD-dependent oxidoreductase, partial [Thermodesulfobacteriota bacterium]
FCLNRACVPTKLFTTTLDRIKMIQTASKMGFPDAAATLNPSALFKLKDELVSYFSMGTQGLVKAKKATPIQGDGRLAGPGRVDAGGKSYQAKAIIIAAGADWVKPSFPGANLEGVIHSSRFLKEGRIPPRTLILGGNAWALELGQFLGGCGGQVMLAVRERGILPHFDQEIGQRLRGILKSSITILNSSSIVSLLKNKEGLKATLLVNEKEEAHLFDRVIYLDRAPALGGLGLETVGLSDLTTNDRLATKIPGIWAAGDATGRMPFQSHRASAMGIIAAENALGGTLSFNEKIVPRVAFTSPQAASVGLTEDEAEEAGYDVTTGAASMGTSPMAMIQGATNGVVKVVGEKEFGELLGVHVLAPFATEIIGTAALAIQMEATLEDLARAVLPHPTIAESLADAARDALGWSIYIP